MKAKMISYIKEEKERITARKLIKKIFTMWLISLFLILGHFSIGSADDQIITTAVGKGIGDNGPALDAILRLPGSLAFYNGEMFIADTNNSRIRKVNLATGIITTVAGTGVPCLFNSGPCGDGGPATEARLAFIASIAFDGEGNLYVADGGRIRKVDALSGLITTYAGGGPPCSSTDPCGDNGPAALATFSAPNDIFVKNGNLYVADTLQQRIRKIDMGTTIITTVAGSGTPCPFNPDPPTCGDGEPATEALLFYPYSIAVDDSENLYIFDQYPGFHKIRKVDSSTRIITTFAGSPTPCNATDLCGDGGPAALASLLGAFDLAVEDGNLYVADQYHNRVRKIDLGTTIITTVAGTGDLCSPTMGLCGDDSLAVNANLNNPSNIATDAAGNLYISDQQNHRIRMIVPGSDGVMDGLADPDPEEIITTVAGMVGKGDGGQAIDARLDNPDASVLDCGGNHFLVESGGSGGNRIREIDMTTGIITTIAGTGINESTGDGGPAVDAQIYEPTSVTCNSTGTAIYFAEVFGNRIRKIDLETGIISTVVGTGHIGFNGDGIQATSANLGFPNGVIERDGNLYIAEGFFDHRIRRVDPDGFIWTVVGTGISGSSGDGGPASDATLFGPWGLNFDSEGNLYITCAGFFLFGDQSVRMVTPGPPESDGVIDGDSDEIIDRVAGTYNTPGFFGDGGPALLARLYGPDTPVIDPEGNLYFTQSGNHIVSKVDLSGIITTVAGMGTIFGFFGDGGSATAALLWNPTGMAMDVAGNTYIDDAANHRVRRLNEAAAYCDIDPDTINLASGGKWATMYYEPESPHTSAQIVKTLIYAVDENGDRISDVFEPEPGSSMSTTADSNGNGVLELMRKFNRASVQALVDEPQTVHIVIEVLFDDGRYGACSHVIRVVEPPVHEPNSSSVVSEPIEEEIVF